MRPFPAIPNCVPGTGGVFCPPSVKASADFIVMKKFLVMKFVPTSTDAGLLIWRVLFGGLLLALHGVPKLLSVSSSAGSFPDPLGIGHQASYWCTVGAEVLAAAFIVLGLCTRWAALGVAFTMAVAFLLVHGGKVSEAELALVYFGGVFPLMFTGAGRFSMDTKLVGGGGGGWGAAAGKKKSDRD